MTEPLKDQTELDLNLEPEEITPGASKTIVFDGEGKEVKTDAAKTGEAIQEAPEETITKLRKEIEETRKSEASAREEARKLAGERNAETQKAVSAIGAAYSAKESSIETALSAAKTDLDSIKRQLREAREKGDIDAEIDLEEKLADTRYNFNAITWQKNTLAVEKKNREDYAKRAAESVQNTPSGYSPKAQAWIDSHPRFNTDDDYQSTVFASHDLAAKRGIIPDSQAYFEFIESRLQKFFPDEGSAVTENPPKQPVVIRQTTNQSLTSTAAPPSRSSGPHRMGTNGSQVTLTAAQLEAADFMGMTPAEYAQDLINQEKEKKGLN